MKLLLLGSGGREHAMAWKISQSDKIEELFIAPGNAGTAQVGTNVNISATDFPSIKTFVIENRVTMVVVGPEIPLVEGIKDFFLNDPEIKSVPVIGPATEGANLEGSKEYAKEFMKRQNIPTAKYLSVNKNNLNDGINFLQSLKAPYVLKADGLAAGKGVLILESLSEAEEELKAMIAGKFGAASNTVVIEEFLSGIELSVFVLTDGKSYKILPEAKDYKRIGEGDTGLNTGGMGAITPVPFADKVFMDKIETRIIQPTIKGIQKENIDFTGFVFLGLINCDGEPKVIEYNVRMGDPETEAVMLRIKSDFVDLLEGMAEGNLAEKTLEIDERSAATVMLVSGGYPGSYENGKIMTGFDDIQDSILFHAGTKNSGSDIVSNGGRVIAISSYGNNFQEALQKSYENASKIKFDGVSFRKDIGFDL